jgi:predicted transcriptional regulator
MIDIGESEILDFIKNNTECTSKEAHEGIVIQISYATVKRILAKLTSDKLLQKKGQGKGTKYVISPAYEILHPIDLEQYYE